MRKAQKLIDTTVGNQSLYWAVHKKPLWENSYIPSNRGDLWTFFLTGGYDERLKENREYLLELKHVCEEKGILDNVVFSPSCSTEERNEFLSSCLCLIYTPTVIVLKCLRVSNLAVQFISVSIFFYVFLSHQKIPW